MKLTIRTRFIAFTAFASAALAVVGYYGIAAAEAHASDSEAMYNATEILRHHMEVDMMHDALKADVLDAAVTTDPDAVAAAVSAGKEHIAHLRGEHGAAAEKARAVDSLRGRFADTAPAIAAYAGACEGLLERARRDGGLDPAALEELRGPYESLEAANEATSDLVLNYVRSTKDAAAVAATDNRSANLQIAVGSVIVLLATAAWFAWSILTSIRRTAEAIRSADASDRELTFGDEFDQVGKALGDAIREQTRLRDDARAAEARVRAIMARVEGDAHSVAAASEQLDNVSRDLSQSSRNASTQAQAVSSSAEGVSRSVESVAAAVNEMNASITEIARSVAGAVEVAQRAVGVAETTNATVCELGEASQNIGNVVKVITSIAEQTNLLALNATIEAARAGESGKGFAVVANEVKELARDTARATEDIGRRVGSIQVGTRGAVEAIGKIREIIHQIHEFQNTIASAVEEQTVMSTQIERSLAEASRGSGDIAHAVSSVATAAQEASIGTESIRSAAVGLAENARSLRAALGGQPMLTVVSGKAA